MRKNNLGPLVNSPTVLIHNRRCIQGIQFSRCCISFTLCDEIIVRPMGITKARNLRKILAEFNLKTGQGEKSGNYSLAFLLLLTRMHQELLFTIGRKRFPMSRLFRGLQ